MTRSSEPAIPARPRAGPDRLRLPLDEAVAWIRQQASEAGFGQMVSMRPEKLTRRSVVLQVVTTSGRLFFKSGGDPARGEGPLTAFLARRYPAHFPAVIAVEAAHGWILMGEVRGPTLMSRGARHPERAFEALGRVQVGLTGAVDALFELGCRHRAPSSLAGHVDAFVESWCLRPDTSAATRRRLAAAAPVWKRLCAEPIPGLPEATLDHADLHPRNVVLTRAGGVFLDWEGGAIGHPFWSPLVLLGYLDRLLPGAEALRCELRTAYLRPWTAFLPMPELAAAFERARPLASLKYAFGLWRLLAADETGEEADNLRSSIRACLDTALAATP